MSDMKNEPVNGTAPLRIAAVILWVLAILSQCAGMLAIGKKADFCSHSPQTGELICFLVLDLILLILGSSLWKKANQRKPALKKDGEFKWWLTNNIGVIAAAACFLPFLLLPLGKAKDPRTKKAASLAAALILLLDVVFVFL